MEKKKNHINANQIKCFYFTSYSVNCLHFIKQNELFRFFNIYVVIAAFIYNYFNLPFILNAMVILSVIVYFSLVKKTVFLLIFPVHNFI